MTEVAPVMVEQVVTPRFSRPALKLLAAGASVGALAAWALDGGPLGLGFSLVIVAWAVALLKLGGREGWQVARGQRWLVAAAIACGALVMVRDNFTLVTFDAMAALGLLLLASSSWNGREPIVDVSLGGLVARPVTASVNAIISGAHLLGEAQQNSRAGSRIGSAVGPMLRTVVIAGPVIVIVTALLAVGDASFGQRLTLIADRVVALPVSSVVRAGFVFLMATPIAGGLVAFALRRREQPVGAATAGRGFALGATESFALVVGLALVAFAYGLNSAECALSPGECVLPGGFTYAMYAREGFFQLLVAAGLTLAVLVAVPPRVSLVSAGTKRAFRIASTLLVAATLPMLASAFRRLGLYEATYGFTGERVWAQAGALFIAMMLAWRGLTLWTWPWRFGAGALASSVVVLLGMNAFNPDAFIARQNLARPSTGVVSLDRAFLATLSADAAPVLNAAGLASLDARVDSVAGFNFARYRALHLPCSAMEEGQWHGEGSQSPPPFTPPSQQE